MQRDGLRLCGPGEVQCVGTEKREQTEASERRRRETEEARGRRNDSNGHCQLDAAPLLDAWPLCIQVCAV